METSRSHLAIKFLTSMDGASVGDKPPLTHGNLSEGDFLSD